MKPILSTLLLGVLAVGVSNAALAAKEVNSSIDQFSYHLIDLDPTDGITPSISFSYYGTSHDYAYQLSPTDTRTYDWQSGGVGVPFQKQMTFAAGSYSASYNGGMMGDYAAHIQLSDISEVESSLSLWGNFTLSPKTAIEIVGHAKGNVIAEDMDGSGHEYASSKYIIRMVDRNFTHEVRIANVVDNNVGPRAYDDNFHLLFSNDSADSSDGSMSMDMYSYARESGTVPIPEPESWGMLLCGLGVLGWMTRRRAIK